MKRLFVVLVFLGFLLGFISALFYFSFKANTGIKQEQPTKNSITPNTSPPPTSAIDQESSGSGKTIFGIGQLCGGVGNIPCPPELFCQKEDNSEGSSGFCAKR